MSLKQIGASINKRAFDGKEDDVVIAFLTEQRERLTGRMSELEKLVSFVDAKIAWLQTHGVGPSPLSALSAPVAPGFSTCHRSHPLAAPSAGKQQGDPMRGARAIMTAVEAARPPMHLVIGGDALDQIRMKLANVQRDLDAWEELSRSTDFQDTP